jgi:hypothetical protein
LAYKIQTPGNYPEESIQQVKFTLEQARRAYRGSKGTAPVFLQPRLYMRVGGQRHAPAALYPVPIVQEVGFAPGIIWKDSKNLALPGFDLQTVRPAANRFTNYAIPVPSYRVCECVSDCEWESNLDNKAS